MGALPSVPVSGAGPGPWGALPPMPPVVRSLATPSDLKVASSFAGSFEVAPASTLPCALWASQCVAGSVVVSTC